MTNAMSQILKMDSSKLIIYLLISLVMMMSSCTKQERNRLNQRELAVVDSLYSQRLPELRIKSDSVCKSLRDSIFLTAVDSLLEIRLAEIEVLVEDR